MGRPVLFIASDKSLWPKLSSPGVTSAVGPPCRPPRRAKTRNVHRAPFAAPVDLDVVDAPRGKEAGVLLVVPERARAPAAVARQ